MNLHADRLLRSVGGLPGKSTLGSCQHQFLPRLRQQWGYRSDGLFEGGASILRVTNDEY
jgi:hypothetical protein